ncbi:MAG: DUF5969 family protein, partial [Isosphaeraceae bacterium]
DGGDHGGAEEQDVASGPGATARTLILAPDFSQTEFARTMNANQVDDSRQGQLLTHALTDEDSVYHRDRNPLGEYRKGRHTFRGYVFDVTGIVGADALRVLEVRMLTR